MGKERKITWQPKPRLSEKPCEVRHEAESRAPGVPQQAYIHHIHTYTGTCAHAHTLRYTPTLTHTHQCAHTPHACMCTHIAHSHTYTNAHAHTLNEQGEILPSLLLSSHFGGGKVP